MALDAQIPRPDEIREELRRILASEFFSASAIKSNILRFLVEKALAQQEISSHHVHEAIYRNVRVSATTAKSNINLVRSRLRGYNEKLGSNSMVRITLPPGRGYRPLFHYNGDARLVRLHRAAAMHQQALTLKDLARADVYFRGSLNMDASNLAAHLGRAETLLMSALQHGIFGMRSSDALELAQTAEIWAQKARNIGADFGEVRLLYNLARVMSQGTADFGAFFNMQFHFALKQQKPEHTWWLFYLAAFAPDSMRRTVDVLEARLRENPADYNCRLALAAFYYVLRRSNEATKCLLDSWQWPSKDNDAAHLVRALVDLEGEAFHDAWRELSAISKDTYLADTVPPEVKSLSRVPGFATLALAKWQGKDAAEKFLAAELREQRRKLPRRIEAQLLESYPQLPALRPRAFQLAVAYAALGRTGRALASLRRARRERDVLMAWLPRMPFCDSLRAHPLWVSIFPEEKLAVFDVAKAKRSRVSQRF